MAFFSMDPFFDSLFLFACLVGKSFGFFAFDGALLKVVLLRMGAFGGTTLFPNAGSSSITTAFDLGAGTSVFSGSLSFGSCGGT
jgi:hypothetical protein